MATRKQSIEKSRSSKPVDRTKVKLKRKAYSAAFKRTAMHMIEAGTPRSEVAKRLKLPAQTLQNWIDAHGRDSAVFSDRVQLAPEEVAWTLTSVDNRLATLSKRAKTPTNLDELALLHRLKIKLTRG
jgi:transposase-like protein